MVLRWTSVLNAYVSGCTKALQYFSCFCGVVSNAREILLVVSLDSAAGLRTVLRSDEMLDTKQGS